PVVAANVSYPNATAYLPITAGTYDVDVRAAGTDEVLLHIAGWSIAPDQQATVIIIDGADGKLDVVPLVDSATVSTMPAGGVQTGLGGMAPPELAVVDAPLTMAFGALAGGGFIALAVRCRRRPARP